LLPDQKPVSIKSITQDVEDIAQQLSIKSENLIVVGHSMGAIVVSELAIKLNLKGAVLIGPVLPKPAMGQIFNARIETVKQSECSSY
jgi:pimeloyl-ACP methyl ester carboxylesterase